MYNTGDIIVDNEGAFGHVAMCFGEEDANGVGDVTFIHGTNAGNFSIGQKIDVIDESKPHFWQFKPIGLTLANKARLKEVATAMQRTAKYGWYRGIRVWVGSSTFGEDALAKLIKYRTRLLNGATKFVSTITCAEAIILCYQLTFDPGSPFFIQKDAAHVMPRDLAQLLKEAPDTWTMAQTPGKK
jgi:hypothetical protein